MARNGKGTATAALLLILFAAFGRSAEKSKAAPDSQSQSPGRPIRASVQLVVVNVSVLDSDDRFVTGLEKGNFQIYEDKKAQQIAHFSREEVPASIGVIFDTSGSMGEKLDRARTALAHLLRTSHPQDEFFLIEFNDRPRELMDFARDTAQIQDKLIVTQSQGRTALVDAVYGGLAKMRKAHNARKALLVLSDGGDNFSRYTPKDLRQAVKESDAQIYALGIFDPLPYRQRTREEMEGPWLLDEIAQMTGGRAYAVENLADLPTLARKLAWELRNLYVLGYSPSNPKPEGKWRKIQVKLILPKGLVALRSFSRAGYFAPSQ